MPHFSSPLIYVSVVLRRVFVSDFQSIKNLLIIDYDYNQTQLFINEKYMQDAFKKYEIELEDSEIQTFEKFLEIFKEKNAQINLSAIRDDAGIIEKHFIDSIILNIFIDLNSVSHDSRVRVADM